MRRRWAAAGDESRGVAALNSPEKANPALQGSVRAAAWPWGECATCVVLLGVYLDSGRLGAGWLATMAALGGESRRCAVSGLRRAWIRAPKGSGSRRKASSTRSRGCGVLCRASRTWPRRLCGLRRGRSHGTGGVDDLGSPIASARVRQGHGEAYQGLGVDCGTAQRQNSGGAGAARRSSSTGNPVRSGA